MVARPLLLVASLDVVAAVIIASSLVAQTSPNAVKPACIEGCGGGSGPSEVSVTPHAGNKTVAPNGALDSVSFTVKNIGSIYIDTYYLTLTCSGVTCPSSGNPRPSGPLTMAPLASTTVWAKYYHPASPSSGWVSLDADDLAGFYDDGTWNITALAQGAPTVALHNFNGVNQDRSLCLTVGAGQAASLACGDLFVTHAMPGYRTMNRSRQLTLFYSSAAAAPRPTVAVWVTQPNVQTPNGVFAKLMVNGVVKDSATYSAWGAGVSKQIVLGYDASGDASGLYPFTLVVRNVYSGASYDATVSDTLIVVNRSSAEFGAGWWLEGVEQLVLSQPGSRILWLGGDGSAAAYNPAGTNTWVRAAGPFHDTLVYNPTYATYTRTLRHGIQVLFDAAGHHQLTVNRAGNTTSFIWSGSPTRLTTIYVPPGGGFTNYSLAYDASNNLSSITDPAMRVLFASVSGGNLMSITDPDTHGVSFGYDGSRHLTSRTSRRGYTTRYYFTNGLHVDSVQVPLGAAAPNDTARTTMAWWDERGLAIGSPGSTQTPADTLSSYTRIKGPRAGVADSARFWVDRWGAPVKMVGAVNETTLISRSTTTGLVTRLETPVHDVWGVTYDGRGNALTVTDSTHEGHGTGGFLTATTTYVYNDPNTKDSPSSVADPEGFTTTYVYNALGLDSLVTAPNGHQTRFLYAGGGLAGLVDTVTELSVRTYSDTTGWSTNTTTVDQTTRLSYTRLGNLQAVTTPMGSVTWYAYNGYQQDTSVTNAVGNVTQYYWRPIGALDSIVQLGAGGERRRVSNTYDADFNRLTTADPRNVTRSWAYDAAGRDTSETDDYGYTERRYYGPSGLLDSVRTRSNVLVRRTYDAAGRMTRLSFPALAPDSGAALGDTVNLTYDAAGRLLLASNRNGTISRTYYREGTIRQDSATTSVGLGYNVVLRYRYLRNDLRSLYTDFSVGLSDTIQVSYSYPAPAGLLNNVIVRYPIAALQSDTATYQWDGMGRRQQLVTPHHHYRATLTWYYDADGRLRRLRSTAPCLYNCQNDSAQVDVRYQSYDSLARPLKIWQTVGQYSTFDSSAFDHYGQLMYQSQDVIGHNYGYDLSGNMTSDVRWVGGVRYGRAYVTDSGHNRLIADSSLDQSGARQRAAFFYSTSGNRLYDEPHSSIHVLRDMWYDALSRMTSIGSYATSSFVRTPDMYQVDWISGLPPITDTAYVQTSVYSAFYDGCRYDALGRRIRACSGLPLAYDGAAMVRAGTSRIIYGAGFDDPLVAYDPGYGDQHILNYYLTDGAGSLLSYTDSLGYDQRVGSLNVYPQAASMTGVAVRSHRFTSAAAESYGAEDLSFYRNRYYDQRTGRWTQEDPIGPAGGVNLYAYVGNNPAAYTDPFGLCTQADGWKDCNRMINSVQGLNIVQSARRSGEWAYSQGQPGEPAVSYANHVGDCTDYCRNAVQATLGSVWAGGAKANTAAFKQGLAAGFTEVEAGLAQPGDVVVQGAHAGIFTGINAAGEVRALANNGTPTSSSRGYYDGRTEVTTFSEGAFGAGPVRFYRPLVQPQ